MKGDSTLYWVASILSGCDEIEVIQVVGCWLYIQGENPDCDFHRPVIEVCALADETFHVQFIDLYMEHGEQMKEISYHASIHCVDALLALVVSAFGLIADRPEGPVRMRVVEHAGDFADRCHETLASGCEEYCIVCGKSAVASGYFVREVYGGDNSECNFVVHPDDFAFLNTEDDIGAQPVCEDCAGQFFGWLCGHGEE